MIQEELARVIARMTVGKGSDVLELIESNRPAAVLIFGREAVEGFERRLRRSVLKQAAALQVLDDGDSLAQAAQAAREQEEDEG